MKRPAVLLCILLLPAALLLAWGNHFRNGFHFDDTHTVVNNIFIRDLGNIPRFFRDATTFSAQPKNQVYRPLVSTSLAIDYRLAGGLDPFYFHLSTFLIFLLQGALMFSLFRTTFSRVAPGEDATAPALFGASWYLLHPANAETINYVIARGDSISTMFVVLTLVLFASPPARRWHLYLLPAALGVLTKPVAVVFAPLLFAWELLFGGAATDTGGGAGGRVTSRWLAAVRVAAPAFLTAVLLLVLVQALSAKTWVPGGASRLGYVITQPLAILYYLGTFFLPLWLSADTDWQPLASVADPRFFAGAAGLLALIGLAVVAGRHRLWRPVSFGLGWFLVAVVPTSFVFPLAEVTNDHRMFFPFVGLAMAVSWTAARCLRQMCALRGAPWVGSVSFAGAILLLGSYALGTHQRNEIWRTEETLWRDVTAKRPKNARGLLNYGVVKMNQGEYAAAEAAFARVQAVGLTPSSYLHVYQGLLKEATGHPAEAEESFRRALVLMRTLPAPYFVYASFLVRQNRPVEALPLLKRALFLAPADLDTRHELLAVYRLTGAGAELESLARETLLIAPDDPVARAALGGTVFP